MTVNETILKVQQGATEIITFDVDADFYPNLTSSTLAFSVRNEGDNTVVFSPSITAITSTQAVGTITYTQTAALTTNGKYLYFVEATNAGVKYPIARGRISVIRGNV